MPEVTVLPDPRCPRLLQNQHGGLGIRTACVVGVVFFGVLKLYEYEVVVLFQAHTRHHRSNPAAKCGCVRTDGRRHDGVRIPGRLAQQQPA